MSGGRDREIREVFHLYSDHVYMTNYCNPVMSTKPIRVSNMAAPLFSMLGEP